MGDDDRGTDRTPECQTGLSGTERRGVFQTVGRDKPAADSVEVWNDMTRILNKTRNRIPEFVMEDTIEGGTETPGKLHAHGGNGSLSTITRYYVKMSQGYSPGVCQS